MTARFILALDQGTTSSRAVLFDAEGTIQGISQCELPQIFPRPGWVEHDPLQIRDTQIRTALEVLERQSLTAADVAAIGITNQRETVILWDRRTGDPVSNAIVWQDRRTAGHCDRLRSEGHADWIRDRTGLEIDAYFSASKLSWLLEHVPGLKERAAAGELAFGTVDSWLVYLLTGRHLTDGTNASRTLLYDIHRGQWDPELLELFGVPSALLPEVRSSSEFLGESRIAGLEGIPIAGIAGDQQAALAGQLCTERGQAKNTYGTGCFLLESTGPEPVASSNRLLTTVACTRSGEATRYALEGSVFIGGAVVQWLRDGLGLLESAAEVESLARTVPDSGGVFLVPAFVGLGAPHWDPHARGTICGITRGTNRGHIARAALESIAFQVADLLDAMSQDVGAASELRVDGGAAVNDLLLQLQADILGLPVVRPTVIETTALGAAYMAGLGVGFWKDHGELSTQWKQDAVFEPRLHAEQARELRQRWSLAVERSRAWAAPSSTD